MPFSSLADLQDSRVRVVGGFDVLWEKWGAENVKKVPSGKITEDPRHFKKTPKAEDEKALLQVRKAFVLRTMEDFAPALSGYVTFEIQVGKHAVGIKSMFHFYAVVPRTQYEFLFPEETLEPAPIFPEKTLEPAPRKSTIEGGRKSALNEGFKREKSSILVSFDSDSSSRRKTLVEEDGPILEEPINLSFEGIPAEKLLLALWQNAAGNSALPVLGSLKHAKTRIDSDQTFFSEVDLTVGDDTKMSNNKRSLKVFIKNNVVTINEYERLHGVGKVQRLIAELQAQQHSRHCCVMS